MSDVGTTEIAVFNLGEVVLCSVTRFDDIGVMVMLPRGFRGHVSRSEISWTQKRPNPTDFFFAGQQILLKVVKVDRSRQGALIVELSRKALEDNPWPNIESTHAPGTRFQSRVVAFLPFGATVELSTGFHALLHDSELAWPNLSETQRVGSKSNGQKASASLQIGSTIDVVVQRLDIAKRKLWVSHRLTTESPWDSAILQHTTGQLEVGHISNMVAFGYFITLKSGCVGLLHRSELPENADDVYDLGDEISVEIAEIDKGQRRIRLRIPIAREPSDDGFQEGKLRRVTKNIFERNGQARRICIAHYGPSCCVCGMTFSETYGEEMEGFIHVHHLVPVSSRRSVYSLDPINDLRPVCPNCHAVLHSAAPPRPIDEARTMMEAVRKRDNQTLQWTGPASSVLVD